MHTSSVRTALHRSASSQGAGLRLLESACWSSDVITTCGCTISTAVAIQMPALVLPPAPRDLQCENPCTALLRVSTCSPTASTKDSHSHTSVHADGAQTVSLRLRRPQLVCIIPVWLAKIHSRGCGGHHPHSQRCRLCAIAAGESFAARMLCCVLSIMPSSCAVQTKGHMCYNVSETSNSVYVGLALQA